MPDSMSDSLLFGYVVFSREVRDGCLAWYVISLCPLSVAHAVCLFLIVGLLSVVMIGHCWFFVAILRCHHRPRVHHYVNTLIRPPPPHLPALLSSTCIRTSLLTSHCVLFAYENVTIRAFVSCLVVIVSSSLSLSLFALLYVSSLAFFPGTIRVSLSVCRSVAIACQS